MTIVPLPKGATLRDAIFRIEESRRGIAIVCDDSKILRGTITDGDVRRGILRGADLDTSAARVMNRSPLTAAVGTPDDVLLTLLNGRGLEAIPLVDSVGRFERVAHLCDLLVEVEEISGGDVFVAAVVMAGGEGRRLRPLTKTIPKPMVEIGGMPLVERHVRGIARMGVEQTFLAVNYLSDVIENHMKSAGPLGTEIFYLREDRKLGTAGALCLLPDLPPGPILVVNSDVVHAADYGNLFDFHQAQGAAMTVCAVKQQIQIPFGVISMEDGLVSGIDEKPSQRFLCNAGIYVLGDEARPQFCDERAFDMTDVIAELTRLGKKVSVFPIHEYWADVADLDDLARVREEICQMDKVQ